MIRAFQRAVLAVGLLSAGCASRPETAQRAATPEPTQAAEPAMDHGQHMAALPASPGPGFTVADVRFMQNMIGHHAQAIVMSAMAPSHGASDDVLRLAQKIDISQRDEIGYMKSWLTDRKQAVPSDAHAHTMMMPGMLTEAQMAQLAAARGREFDRLFLRFMIGHHEGALQMVKELFDNTRAGQDPEIFRFATDVDADQRDEIYVMQGLLDTIREEPR